MEKELERDLKEHDDEGGIIGIEGVGIADPSECSPFQPFSKADDVKELVSDFEQHSHHFDEAERGLRQANRIYNITLSRVENQPRVKVTTGSRANSKTVKTP